MNAKTKELLLDLAHEIHKAIITDDDAIASVALADVADALASILPIEHPASPLTPPLPGRAASMTPPPDEPQGFAKFLTVAPGVRLVRFAGKDDIILTARRKGLSGNPNTIFSIDVSKELRKATVFRDRKVLFVIHGYGTNYSMVEHCAISALRMWFKRQRPSPRQRRRAARLRAAAITNN